MTRPVGRSPLSVRTARRLYRLGRRVLPRTFETLEGPSLQAFFDEAVRDAHASGGWPMVARRTVSAVADLVSTACREHWDGLRETTAVLNTLPREARAAARGLRRARAFSVGLLVALVLGVGVGAALFTVVHAALAAPLPVADEGTLVHVGVVMDGAPPAASYPEYRDWRDGARALRSVAAYSRTSRTATGLDVPVRVSAALVTANFFETLGVPMAEGRAFTSDEEPEGADGVVILSHAFRVRHYTGVASVIGRVLRLGDRPYEIVGVLPRGFRFDLEPAEVFLPLGLRPLDLERRESRWLGVIGRLRTGDDAAASGRLEPVRAELEALSRAAARAAGNTGTAPLRVDVRTLRDAVVGNLTPILWLLGGAALLVTLAASASVGALALTRAIGRRRELAIRAALGASRWERLTAVMMEFVLLGAVGAVAAAIVGAWTARLAVALLPASVVSRATWLEGGPPIWLLLLFSLVLAAVACLPAVALAARDLQRSGTAGALRARAAGGLPARPLRRVLVSAQVALALVLLIGTGLMTRSLVRLLDVDPGFAPDRLLAMSVSLPVQRYPDGASVARLYDELTRRVAALPGVDQVGTIDEMPFTKDDGMVEVTTAATSAGDDPVMAVIRSASPGYFDALGITPSVGRVFDAADTAERPSAAVITTTLARRLFPDGRAIGRQLALTRSTGRFEIIGVVGDVRMGELDHEVLPAFYTCSLQDPSRSVQLVARTDVPAESLARDVRGVLQALDPDVPVYAVQTFRQARDETRAVVARRMVLFPLLLFGALATAIAAVGVYALTSQAVAERTSELGIRIALGATRGGVHRLVLRQGLLPAAAGVATGLVFAALTTRALGRVLYGVPAIDPVTFLAAAALMLALTMVAAAGPASRASRLDPARTLRAD